MQNEFSKDPSGHRTRTATSVGAINDRLSQRTQLRNEGRNLSRQFPQSDQ